MIIKNVSFPTPQENILYDDVLLALAEKEQKEFIRFWESAHYFIVLGRIGKLEEDVELVVVQKDRIPVLRRSSGGGTVVQGPGCFNYTFVLDKRKHSDLSDLRKSYQYILNKVIQSLQKQNIHSVFKPISDLAIVSSQKKFSGNAQKRSKNFILHHGTILYGFQLDLIHRYLKMPKDVPEYRKGRAHLDFVTNIAFNKENFKKDLTHFFTPTFTEEAVSPIEEGFLKSALSSAQIALS